MKYSLRLSLSVHKGIKRHNKAGNKKLLEKLEVLFRELRDHPRTGTGHPEPLKHELTGMFSRRIDQKHRLIYEIDDEIVTVIVLSAYGHYDDK